METIVVFVFLLVSLIGFVFIVIRVFETLTMDVPFISTPNHVIKSVVGHFGLTPKSVLYDLGCGDGRILRMAAAKYPSIRAVGIEGALIPYSIATFLTRKNPRIHVRRENIFSADISDATHVFMFLYPKIVNDLAPLLEKKCRPGTRIISCDYEIFSLKPVSVVDLRNSKPGICQKLFVYEL